MPGPQEFAEPYVSTETPDREAATWMEAVRPYCWREAEAIQRPGSPC